MRQNRQIPLRQNNSMKKGKVKIAAVILAAGKDKIMGSDSPNVLNEICGKPFLYYSLKTLKELSGCIGDFAELESISVVVGYGADKVKAAFKNDNINWVYQKEPEGSGRVLTELESSLRGLKGLVLFLCGDAPLMASETLKELIGVHLNAPESKGAILTCKLDDPAGCECVIKDKKGIVNKIIDDARATAGQKKINEIGTGAFVFDSQIFDALIESKTHLRKNENDLTDIIDAQVKKGDKFLVYSGNAQECLSISNYGGLDTARRLMSGKIINAHIHNGVTVIAPENTYIEEGVQIGDGAIVYPFTVIHSGVLIGRNCHVGPFSHLRSGTILHDGAEVGNFTETKKTQLGRNSKAKHLSYLGDAVIGANVNIGAGTITANYDGVKKDQTIIEDGASTGSGTILIAPVKMGKNTKTGAGAVIAKGKNVSDGETVVGIPARVLKRSHK